MMLVISVVVGVLCAMLCRSMAADKNRNTNDAVILGLMLGIIGVLIVACWKAHPPKEIHP